MTTDPNNSLGSEESEDLFDFPLVGAYAAQELEAVSETANAPEAAPVAEAAPAAAPVAATPAPAVAKAAPVIQEISELDEDIFDFETQFATSQPLTSGEEELDLGAMLEKHEAEVEAAGPAPPAPAQQSAPAAPAPAPQAAAAQAAAPAATITPQPATAPRMPVSSDIPEAMWAPPMAAPAPEGKRGYLVEILAVCFLVLTTALVLIAWRASDDFRATLASVTSTVSDAVADGQSRGQAMGSQGSMTLTPDVNNTQIQPDVSIPDAPSNIVLLPRATLDLAIDRIAEGKFQVARQGLFHLLANQDRAALTDEMVVEAEALIAEAFAKQAKEIQQ